MESFVPPDRYLGANFEKVQLYDGHIFRSTNNVNHLNSSIDNVNNSIGVDKSSLKNYGDMHRPSSSSYRPELEITEELGE